MCHHGYVVGVWLSRIPVDRLVVVATEVGDIDLLAIDCDRE